MFQQHPFSLNYGNTYAHKTDYFSLTLIACKSNNLDPFWNRKYHIYRVKTTYMEKKNTMASRKNKTLCKIKTHANKANKEYGIDILRAIKI